MFVNLDRDAEKAVSEEVQAGRFRSVQEFVDTAIRQFLIAREFGEEGARKLATLRDELQRADEQIDRGECSEYDEYTLKEFFDEVEAEKKSSLADKGNFR